MKKIIFLFSVGLLLTFVSCADSYLYKESEKEEPKKEEPSSEIEDWKDGGTEKIDMFPD